MNIIFPNVRIGVFHEFMLLGAKELHKMSLIMRKMFLLMAVAMSGLMMSAQSRLSFTPEAGLTVNKENEGKSETTLGFKAGVGVLYNFKEAEGAKPSFGIRSGLFLLMQKGNLSVWNLHFPGGIYYPESQGGAQLYPNGEYGSMVGRAEGDKHRYGILPREMTRFNLQLPIMAHWSFKLADDISLNLAVGPYVAFALGGNAEAFRIVDGVVDYNCQYDFNPFRDQEFMKSVTPRFDWGGTALVGLKVKRFSFNIGYDLAWGKYNKAQNDLRIRNHQVSFTFGYTL